MRAVDGIFQVIRAFDDAEVIHVEGDVNPLRDMEIIQTELRLKDIEWVEKALEALKKTTRALGNTSLADRAKKEEIVSLAPCHWRDIMLTENVNRRLRSGFFMCSRRRGRM